MKEYTPHQQKIIKRYYDQQPQILHQRLGELVGNLFLAQGNKRQQLWLAAAETMKKLGVPQPRIDHLLQKGDPALLATVVSELEGKK